MREIKFKYIFSDGKEFKSTVLSLAAIENGALKSFINNIPSSFELVAVCQFTGLKDKKGVEIYEGDILNHHKQGNRVVEYSNSDMSWGGYMLVSVNGMRGSCNDTKIYKVIGNIYENKELLC